MATRRDASSSQCFSNKLLKFCTNERFEPSKTESSRDENVGGRVGRGRERRREEQEEKEKRMDPTWIMHHAYILRRTPLVSLWTFDNSVNQLSRISYPLCLVLTLVAVRKSRLIFKRWEEGNCWPTFWSIRSLELNLARYFTKVGWCKKDKLYVWKMMKRWKICHKIEGRDVYVQGINTFVK